MHSFGRAWNVTLWGFIPSSQKHWKCYWHCVVKLWTHQGRRKGFHFHLTFVSVFSFFPNKIAKRWLWMTRSGPCLPENKKILWHDSGKTAWRQHICIFVNSLVIETNVTGCIWESKRPLRNTVSVNLGRCRSRECLSWPITRSGNILVSSLLSPVNMEVC